MAGYKSKTHPLCVIMIAEDWCDPKVLRSNGIRAMANCRPVRSARELKGDEYNFEVAGLERLGV
jgi:hypothetical protein